MTEHGYLPQSVHLPFRPKGLSDLIDIVPFLLGFHPTQSLVLAVLAGDRGALRSTLRVDLSELRASHRLGESLAGFVARDGGDCAVGLVFAGRDLANGDLPDRDVIHALAGAMDRRRTPMVDALYVGETRWWSYACRDPVCCPPSGTPLSSSDGSVSPAVAAATYAGLVALPDRTALRRTLEPASERARAAVARAMAAAEERAAEARRERGVDAWRGEALGYLSEAVDRGDGQGPPDDGVVADLLVALRDQEVRDRCCDWCHGSRGGAALRLWQVLSRLAEPPYLAAPVTLVAWVAWQMGSGPLARIAVERALRADPDYRLAVLLENALDHGLHPDQVPAWSEASAREAESGGSTGGG